MYFKLFFFFFTTIWWLRLCLKTVQVIFALWKGSGSLFNPSSQWGGVLVLVLVIWAKSMTILFIFDHHTPIAISYPAQLHYLPLCCSTPLTFVNIVVHHDWNLNRANPLEFVQCKIWLEKKPFLRAQFLSFVDSTSSNSLMNFFARLTGYY